MEDYSLVQKRQVNYWRISTRISIDNQEHLIPEVKKNIQKPAEIGL